MKKVILLSTGGTIASTPHHAGRAIAGALTGSDLAAQIETGPDIELDVQSVFQKPSNAITMADLHELRSRCQTLVDKGGVDGIVITHGTDTLEETAYFLDTTLRTDDVVIVVTGSQRVPHAMGTDAFVNLQNAVLVAADKKTRHMGVLVSFNEMIYSAAFVRKVSSFQVNGFDAPAQGCLGIIDNGVITIYQRPVRLPVLGPWPGTTELGQPAANSRMQETDGRPHSAVVDIVSSYLGARPQLLDAAVQNGARGIVIDALGRGHVPPDWMPSIARAIDAGVFVLVCTSTLHGPVHQTYDFQGSLHELDAIGAIGVSGLTARKARMRLAALLELPHFPDRTAVQDAFTNV